LDELSLVNALCARVPYHIHHHPGMTIEHLVGDVGFFSSDFFGYKYLRTPTNLDSIERDPKVHVLP
jgi:hypothetical protein